MIATVLQIAQELRLILAAGLIIAGALGALIGAVGILRFPDFYSRMHAASITDTMAMILVLLGMLLLTGLAWPSFKLVLIFLFMFLTGPTATHATANAAHGSGLAPLSGRWRSELPGQD